MEIPCGSGLAREEAGTFNIEVAGHSAFASKPAPTVIAFHSKYRIGFKGRCKHDYNKTDHGPGPGEIPR